MAKARVVSLSLGALRTSLVNLPALLVAQLEAQSVTPQLLAVELARPGRPAALFVGWSGLPARALHPWPASRNGPAPEFVDAIELDSSLGLEMGWQENERLAIRFHHQLALAKTVHVEPLTPDDWEILESNPQYLEDHFLTQIRVVAESQTLLIWLYAKTLIRVKVSTIELIPIPAPSTPLPNTPYLITNQTEVIVSPKSRINDDFRERHQVLNGHQPANKEHSGIDIRRQKFKILPHGVHCHSLIESEDYETEGPDQHPIVRINPNQFRDLESTYPSTLCSLTFVPRPNQLNQSKSLASTTPLQDVDHLSTTINNSKSTQVTKTNLTTTATSNRFVISERVRVIPDDLVPKCYVCIPLSLHTNWFDSQFDHPGDYEVVRFGPAKSIPEKIVSSSRSRQVITQEEDKEEEEVFQNEELIKNTRRIPTKSNKQSTTSEILAGFDDHIKFCQDYLRITLLTAQLYLTGSNPAYLHKLQGLLVCGSTGSGKTSLVKRVGELVHSDPKTLLYHKYVNCGKHVDDRLGVLKANLNDWFDEVLWHAPSVLILDDLDKLFPAESEHIDSFRCRHWAEEFISITRAAIENRMIILLGTCSSSSSIHSLLTTGTHLFTETRNLKGLTKHNRKEILSALIDAKSTHSSLDTSRFDPLVFATDKTEGYQPADLKDLVDRAIQQAVIRELRTPDESKPGLVTLKDVDFQEAQSDYVPISLRDVKLEKSDVEWADIGGLHETRRILRETLEWPTKYVAIFAKCPLRLRSGLLLYGYPGCGKTMLASAVARECGLNFISIKGPELLNKYIGASEKSVRDLFERAQVARPCVLFFDEFDSIAPKRGHDSTGVTDRVVNQLLTQMDGAEGLEGVYVLAATSRPDLIDPALLRPGRLDQSLLCAMPDEEERKDILKAVSRKLVVDPDLDLEEVARLSEGFTGADLQALVYAAHLVVVHEQINLETHNIPEQDSSTNTQLEWCEILPPGSSQPEAVKSRAEEEATRAIIEQVLMSGSVDVDQPTEASPAPQVIIQNRHLFKALEDVRPSVPVEELARLGKIYRNFISSRSPTGLPDGEASEQIGGRASLM